MPRPKNSKFYSVEETYAFMDVLGRMNRRSSNVRQAAVNEAEELSDGVRLAIARIGVTDPYYSLRNDAAYTLAVLGTALDQPRVIQLLKDKEWIVRSSATEAAGFVLGKKAQSFLVPMLNDSHPIVRRDAAFALGDLGLETSIEFLKKRLRVEKQEQAMVGLWAALFMLGERQHLHSILKLCLSSVLGLRTLIWNVVNDLVDYGQFSAEELEAIKRAMESTRILAITPSVAKPLNELRDRMKELYPEIWLNDFRGL